MVGFKGAHVEKDIILSCIPPGSAASIGAGWWRGHRQLHDGLLLLGQFFSSGRAVNRSTTSQYL
jgi:hypothetical protein